MECFMNPAAESEYANVIGKAVTVARVATGEVEEQFFHYGKDKAASNWDAEVASQGPKGSPESNDLKLLGRLRKYTGLKMIQN